MINISIKFYDLFMTYKIKLQKSLKCSKMLKRFKINSKINYFTRDFFLAAKFIYY